MSIREDITAQFKKQDNALIKIILISIFFYVVDCLFWLISQFSSSQLWSTFYTWRALPSSLTDVIVKPWTVLTYGFTHDIPSPLHIFFNMLGLFWFGGLIQEYINSRRLVSIFILGIITGAVAFLLFFNFIPPFNQQSAYLVGSSAGLFAVIVAAATLLPEYRFNLLFIGPVKIVYIALFYIFLSLIGTAQHNAGGNLAHLGGALLGFTYIKLLRKGYDLGKPIQRILSWKFFSFRRNKIKVAYRSHGPIHPEGFPNQDEIDFILDKISRSGYESLSKEEKDKLFKASQK